MIGSMPRRLRGSLAAVACGALLVAASPPEGGNHERALRPSSFLNIVAHQDDELLFMNPDVIEGLRNGHRTTTVYITAGEAGFGTDDSDPEPLADQPSCKDLDTRLREQYIECRQRGIRLAYAMMIDPEVDADADLDELWRRQVYEFSRDRQAERYVSTQDPDISLIFLNLPEHSDATAQGGPGALHNLWYEPGTVVRTVEPAGSVLEGDTYEYDRDDLIDALVEIMDRFQPTVVRVQDTHPDDRYQPGWPYHDHTDHVMAGLFASRASDEYLRGADAVPHITVGYRNYNTVDAPANLDDDGTKADVFWAYAQYDTNIGEPGEPEQEHYEGWLQRMYYRWPTGTTWASRHENGRIAAFTVVGGELWIWTQHPSGSWERENLGSPDGRRLAPGVTVARNNHGELEAFVVGFDDLSGSEEEPPAVYRLRQDGANGDWRLDDWDDLGNPNAHVGSQYHIGTPVVAANGDGRLQVFIRNAGGGLSSVVHDTADPDDGFRGWVDHGGYDIQETPGVVTMRDGRVEVFASTLGPGILHWQQELGDETLHRQAAVPSPTPASPPTPAINQDGRPEIYYRVAGTGEVAVSYYDGSRWVGGPAFDGPGGVGAVATLDADGGADDGRITLLTRTASTGVGVNRQRGANEGYDAEDWTDLGNTIVGLPTVAVDNDGRAVALAVGTDGNLYTAHQVSHETDAEFGEWRLMPG
ncbi:PIG-L family deacetylase [Allostreptomyces psammosilenae]|uniref:LmbE family N-acetylglucosaminyl deacetylase n=1 Tax=Allostreptomyces psammosilenae TaxID=1892865 RepID=A0A853A5Y1_9ACTN|nr:PIG-L family deacetylase [Allostreptomyces psammosilenae]NYI08254.1 LmbE family N-acetylglucosaminyl deacetylase [Allostreptomyces psammosilenae]